MLFIRFFPDLTLCCQIFQDPQATFKSQLQKEMLLEVGAGRSGFYGLPCGEGKSLSWLVPTVASLVSGKARRMRLVVVPYNFLVGHSVQDAVKRLPGNLAGPADVVAVTKSSLLSRVPGFLSCEGSFDGALPLLVFLSLDAFACLQKNHGGRLQHLVAKDLIGGFYLDEIQQSVMEASFRESYSLLKHLRKYGAPVFLLSGSMPLPVAKTVMGYVGVQEGAVVVGGSPMARLGFSYRRVRVSGFQEALENAVGEVEKKAKRCGPAFHVICQTIHMVDLIEERLGNSGLRILKATSDVEDTAEVAGQWASGEGDVLITTTCGLTGCEYEKCRHIVVIGAIYSVSNMVQAIGRLREGQRRDGASVTMLYRSTQNWLQRAEAEAAASYQLYSGAGFVDESCEGIYADFFHELGLLKVMEEESSQHLELMSSLLMTGRTVAPVQEKLLAVGGESALVGTRTGRAGALVQDTLQVVGCESTLEARTAGGVATITQESYLAVGGGSTIGGVEEAGLDDDTSTEDEALAEGGDGGSVPRRSPRRENLSVGRGGTKGGETTLLHQDRKAQGLGLFV